MAKKIPSETSKVPTDSAGLQIFAIEDGKQGLDGVKVKSARNPQPSATLGDIGVAAEVTARKQFVPARLILPLDRKRALGVDLQSVRVFRHDGERFVPVWNSGANATLGHVWAKIEQPGIYVAIGLPRDRLLWEILRGLATQRRLSDAVDEKRSTELTRQAFRILVDAKPEAVQELREFLTRVEVQTGVGRFARTELKVGTGGHIETFALPSDATPKEFAKRLDALQAAVDGLPEEQLFYPPEIPREDGPPWELAPHEMPWRGIDRKHWERLEMLGHIELSPHFPWFFCTDWWMYQHDERHSGQASGASDISSTTVGHMYRVISVNVDGPVVTKPCIVDGKIFVGTGRQFNGPGGTLYRIDLATGAIEQTFGTTGSAYYSWVQGIGASPAIVGGRVYFAGLHGKVYCLDAATFALAWETDLKSPNQLQNQPIMNTDGDCWSSPLVVDGKVYVASGEGESSQPFGFIWCLDAGTGRVLWVYCTNKFVDPDNAGNENQPNVIPRSAAVSDPLPAWATMAGFSLHNDPPHRGASPWSSAAYDKTLNRIYICTGNSRPDNPLPDERYASGIISLDADSGEFRGFFQPAASDSYATHDYDVDVPGAPTIFRRGGERVLCFGSKNGSFWLLNPDTMAVLARRQLLPRRDGTGLPGSMGTAIPEVVPHAPNGSGENKWGIMATPAVHSVSGKLFVGLGGYSGMAQSGFTPFLRSLDWDTLEDAWPVALGADGIQRYVATKPPMYLTREPGLSSPAVVRDVVFMSTGSDGTPSGLYAFDIADGLCLWSAGDIPSDVFALGPAISGNYVVLGAGSQVHIYKLGKPKPWWWNHLWIEREPLIPIPRPDPPPFLGGMLDRFER